ncbi:MAG: tetratricopeptide repeat protein [Proteobacteria bacterium]|nr:MAG: tetratricopeptide repeat protein [Pseudomonadota bacterium]
MKLSHLFFLAALALSACASSKPSLEEKRGDVYHTAGLEALRAGRWVEALGAMQEAARYLPKDPAVATNLGLALANKGEYPRAEEAFKKAIKLDPKFTDARLNLGALQIRMLKWKEAEANLREAAKDIAYPNQHQVFFNLALIYGQWNKPVLAEQQLKLAVESSPAFCDAWYRMAKIQKDRGSAGEARESYTHAVSGTCFKEYPDAHYEIASLYLQQKDEKRGKAKLLEVIQLFPETEWARKSELTLNMIR